MTCWDHITTWVFCLEISTKIFEDVHAGCHVVIKARTGPIPYDVAVAAAVVWLGWARVPDRQFSST